MRREIGAVLRRDWDPIGISAEPACSDEYDAYVGGVCRLLADGASAGELATHLRHIETHRLGLQDTDPGRLLPVAHKLREAYARLERPVSG